MNPEQMQKIFEDLFKQDREIFNESFATFFSNWKEAIQDTEGETNCMDCMLFNVIEMKILHRKLLSKIWRHRNEFLEMAKESTPAYAPAAGADAQVEE